MKIRHFRDLRIWQLGMDIVLDVNQISKTWPKHEMFCLTSQARRSALSIPSNIAEGFGRFSKIEFYRFLRISLGSCAELETQIEAAFRLKYLDERTFKQIQDKIDHEAGMINKLIPKTPSLNAAR